jgi:hypothetical protein
MVAVHRAAELAKTDRSLFVLATADVNRLTGLWLPVDAHVPNDVPAQSVTARSVRSRPRSMIANDSRISASVMHSGGFVKNVFHRTKV